MTHKLIEHTAHWSFGTRAAILMAVTLVACAAAAAWRFAEVGTAGILAAVVAGLICGGGALAALAVAYAFRGGGPHARASAVMGGMLFRMGLPLGGLVAFQGRGGLLTDAGVVGCILLIYPVTLLAEVALVVPLAHEGGTRPVPHRPAMQNPALPSAPHDRKAG